jgi:hypothetical protein
MSSEFKFLAILLQDDNILVNIDPQENKGKKKHKELKFPRQASVAHTCNPSYMGD